MVNIFKVFLLLGLMSFGGPAAHIGYFRNAFVKKRAWLSDSEFAQIVALSQFLPGPASSQVGFAIGYKKGGLGGALAAFIGFTLPSVLLMLLLAYASTGLTGSTWFEGVIHGLKLLAVVVVADATMGMFTSFCNKRLGVLLCTLTAVVLMVFPSLFSQLVMLLLAALIGARYMPSLAPEASTASSISKWPLVIFFGLLLGLPTISALGWVNNQGLVGLFYDFFQAGTMVFGGGHVVLPLLQNIVGEQLSSDTFLTGYAAAQAVPGPMFTFATFLGFELFDKAPILGALTATVAIFAPGFLLLLGVLNHWHALAGSKYLSGAIKGVNASVVGLLLAALYQPVFVTAVHSSIDMAMVVAGLFLLKTERAPILVMVAIFIGFGIAGSAW
ncbi:chromate efflux transporter [Paraferrimonas haliotis]|uniref:Chorismate-binding protein n=1 Tax=Paraferrimonas haliotis TaxID=2013866 RepID=A0AA37TP21_9GAMM|nr:chromate efflux transporter [Paraferrimonas haliotis]GLS84118.1 chorismate-binding protein [Paraferrimonas haliotis]